MSSGNNKDLVSVIKQYALFLYKKGETFTAPTDTTWTPAKDKTPIGYSSDDGCTIHPETGDKTEINGHNGNVVYSETTGGYWTLGLNGIELRKSIAEAYFGVEADSNGVFNVPDASTPLEYSLVLAGLDHHGNPIIFYAESAKVSDREDMSLKSSKALAMGVTFTLSKGSKSGYQFQVFGLANAETTANTAAATAA